jgi:hypothetical protein
MNSYSDYQNQASSEKITLAFMSASKRLMGWQLHSGTIYKITGFTYTVIDSIEDSGNAYSAVSSLGAVTASTYYLDSSAQILYLRTTGSDNPNGRFLSAIFKFFFSNVPIVLPFDLGSGFEVAFEPMIKSTSQFGVSIDTIAQSSEALEGTGSLTLFNDMDFWPKYFDKLSFENQPIELYSYNRDLDPSAAQIIFKGSVLTKTYSTSTVVFKLADQFAVLRGTIPLSTIGALGARISDNLTNTFQRMIFGKVFGNRPTNIDQVVNGYPISGTVSATVGSAVVTGTGTNFYAELSPDDHIVLAGKEFTIGTVDSATSLTLSDVYDGLINLSGSSASVVPDKPKRWMNRVWKVSGHALREAVTTTSGTSSILTLVVNSTRDIYAGDLIYIGTLGSGEVAIVNEVIGDQFIKLETSLANPPAIGTTITRPAVQNVRIDDLWLEYYRDYTFNATTGVLTLRSTAEANASPISFLEHNITLTNGSRAVTGAGFQGIIFPGYMIGVNGNATFFEVCSVDSDTQLTLRTAATFTATTAGRYQSLVFEEGTNVLTLDALGRTDDGTTTGVLLKTGPAISKALLTDAGLGTSLDSSSFDTAEEIAYQELGVVIPKQYLETTSPTFRDTMNAVNKSVFGCLVQTSEFQFGYQVLQPSKDTSAPEFSESDILSFNLTSTSEYVVKTAIIEYQYREYDYLTLDESIKTHQKTSDVAQYIVNTAVEKTFSTLLANSDDAVNAANRWSFLLENSASRVTFTTKLQGIRLEIGQIIEIQHRKFFERYGTQSKRRLFMVESVNRSGADVQVEATDLNNAFTRAAAINDFTNDWSTATETEKLYGGYITDSYGLINNEPDSFGSNLIW